MYQPKAHYRAWEKEYSKKGSLWRYESETEVAGYLKCGKLLEVGCGNGKTLLSIARQDFDIAAIDISRKAIELAQKAVGENGKIIFLEGDVCDLQFGDGLFDGIVCSFVLQHLLEGEREKAIFEMRRVLKPGGFLFVDVFSMEDMRHGKGMEVEPETFKRETGILTHYFTEPELRALLENFELVDLKKVEETKNYSGKKYLRSFFRVVCRKPQDKS